MGEAKVEKRNRPPKSCEPCRIRKLKCNRSLPCDTCVRRGKNSLCQYAANADRSEKSEKKTKSMTERLKSLENLISSLAKDDAINTSQMASQPHVDGADVIMSADQVFTNAAQRPLKNVPNTVGDGLLGGNMSNYLDRSHWSSLLEDIREIREQLSPANAYEQSSTAESSTAAPEWTPREETGEGVDLVFGRHQALNYQQILASLPSRQVCDSLVSQYFRPRHAILPILHPVKFQREYEAFWESPTETPIVWVATLFAILSLAASLHEISNIGNNSDTVMPSAKLLSKTTEQCLVLGNYARSEEHSIEALGIHLQSCFLRSKDSDVNLWLLMGVVIRLAIRLGYHRDPVKVPKLNLSPFDGEMRRRIWISIFQVDTLMSFQMGFPSMIPNEYCDAELPRNLDHHDFYPETETLPPSRPLSDSTPILYTIAKAPVVEMFRAVVGHTRSLNPPPYERTMALDTELRQTYSDVPISLRYKALSQSIIDSPSIIMNRTTIEILHLKSIIVLHRQYITEHRQNHLYDFSRHACLEAASTVLDRQAEMHRATQPGSQLYDDRWMVSALTANDFILAAMVLCLELTIRLRESSVSGASDIYSSGTADSSFTRFLTAIETAHQIWVVASAYSIEARMASHALGSTIERVRTHADMHVQYPAQDKMDTVSFHTGSTTQTWPPQHLEVVPMVNDGMEYIDWGVLDSQFHDPLSEDMDLESWILDAVGPWEQAGRV